MTRNPGNPGLPIGTPQPLRHFQGRTTGKSAGSRAGGGGTSFPGVAAPELIQTAILNFVAPQTDPMDGDWVPPNYASVQTDQMVKGANWQVWKDAVLARGVNPAQILEGTSNGYNTIAFQGQACIEFLSMFNVAILGNAPPLAFVQAVKAASRIGTKVGTFFANYETVGQAESANDWWHPIEDQSMLNLRNTGIVQGLAPGANPNSACLFADQGQLTQPPAPAPCGTQTAAGTAIGHTWICDITIPTYELNWFNTMISQILIRYGANVLDYILVDNVLPQINWGTAVNVDAGYTNANYVARWKSMLALADPTLLTFAGTRLIGNCSIFSSAYSATECTRRYGEHFFHDEQTGTNTTSEDESVIHSRITTGQAQNLLMLHHQVKSSAAVWNAKSYGATHVDSWSGTVNGPGGTKGTWSNILLLARQLGITNKLYAVAGRGGTTVNNAFPLFWQDSFTPVA